MTAGGKEYSPCPRFDTVFFKGSGTCCLPFNLPIIILLPISHHILLILVFTLQEITNGLKTKMVSCALSHASRTRSWNEIKNQITTVLYLKKYNQHKIDHGVLFAREAENKK